MTVDTLKNLSLEQLNDLMNQTVEALIYMSPQANVSAFKEKEKLIELIQRIIVAKRYELPSLK